MLLKSWVDPPTPLANPLMTTSSPPVPMTPQPNGCHPGEKSKDSFPSTLSAAYSRTPTPERQVLENSSEELDAGRINPASKFPHDKLDEQPHAKKPTCHLQSKAMDIANVHQVLKTSKGKLLSTLQRNRKFIKILRGRSPKKTMQDLKCCERVV